MATLRVHGTRQEWFSGDMAADPRMWLLWSGVEAGLLGAAVWQHGPDRRLAHWVRRRLQPPAGTPRLVCAAHDLTDR